MVQEVPRKDQQSINLTKDTKGTRINRRTKTRVAVQIALNENHQGSERVSQFKLIERDDSNIKVKPAHPKMAYNPLPWVT